MQVRADDIRLNTMGQQGFSRCKGKAAGTMPDIQKNAPLAGIN